MEIYSPTTRIDGTKILLKYADTPEPKPSIAWDYSTEAQTESENKWRKDQWLSSHKEVELKPEFHAEFLKLVFVSMENKSLEFGDEMIKGVSIESIKHRIGIVYGEGKCKEGAEPPNINFNCLDCDCNMWAVLLPEVKEETHPMYTEADMKAFGIAVAMLALHNEKKSIEQITNSAFESFLITRNK